MRREEQERMRREEQERMRREEQEKKRTREEEMERLRFEEEERRLEEEEEERKRTEEEESRKKEEQEKRRRMEEQEKIRLEEERRILEEKESMQRLKVEEEERMRKEEQERRRLEEKRREMEEQEKLEEEERLRRDEHERMKREDRLRKEEERKMREKEEQLKREKEERTKEEEDRIRRKEKEDVLRREEQRKMEEEERRREDEEIIKREKEAERQREEEERGKKEVEIKRMKEEERLRREEEDRQQMDEERRFREEKRQKKEEEERRIMEEEMQKREEEERRIGEEEMQKKEERLRKEEEERLEVTQKEEAERKKLDEEREREEKQRRTLMEANERLRVEQENKKKDELRRQEERLREEEKMRNVQMKGKVQLQEVEKQLEYRREATVSNNPFEEVSSSPLSDDTFTNDPFEETPTVPVSCRTNKVSAVKPRPSSWGNTPQPCASSSPFRSSSSMDSLRSNVETSGLQDPSTDVRKTKNPTPLLYNIQSCKDDSHISTTNIAVTKPTKPPPPPRRQPSTSLVDGSGDQGSVTGPDHPSVRQNKDVATLPPDSQRWPSKDKRPGKSNCHSASPTLTPTKTTNPLPPPPRRHSATSLIGSRNDHPLLQSNSKDQTNTRRDKHPAPPPPGRSSQAPSQTQNNQSMTGVNHGPKGTVGASVSTVSQCVVQITPLIPSEDTTEQTGGGQSFTHFGKQAEKLIPSDAENMMVAKHNKGPAPSRPKYPPEKVKPNADIVDKQSHTDEHNSSVVFDQNNPFAEDCRRESLCGGSEEQIKTLVSTHAASGPLQKSLCGDTIDLPRVEFGPAKDPSRTTSAKRVRAPLPPGSKLCTPREEEAVEPSCVKSQSSGAPAPNKLSSSVLVKTQNRGVGVALPCVIVAQSSSAPSPPISSPPHPEPLKASEGRTHPTPQTTHTVSGPKSRLHAVPLPIIRQCSGEDAGGTGGRSASSTIRPHPVKPLNSPENQPAPNMQESQPGKTTEKVKDTEVRGPYSQLTQEELISLVMKQQEQLSNRDNKIKELEQYIDNLLVRILDEHPSILMSMNSHK
ncbi:hypothetical protein UPYG_G00283570 [Umbra pygmaea]|uniref:FIP-RBD domain-containing protein n=1 Tax=Umbra pygmaea TaxID=75934 RepID=A0ABD0W867_UMBPY